MKKLGKIAIFAVVVIAILYSCGKRKINNTFINTVKDGYFYGVSEDVTIGEIMKKICTDSKWECKPTETGQVFVNYSGKMNGKNLKLHFFVFNALGDMNFRLNGFEFNGDSVDGSDPNSLEAVPYLLYEQYKQKAKK